MPTYREQRQRYYTDRLSKRDENVPIVPEKIMELYTNETTSITPVSF